MTEAELFREALVHTPESVSICELDGTVVWMNPATERLMGMTLDTVRGKRLFELYPDMIGTAFHTAFVRVAEGAPPEELEHYYPRFDAWFANCVKRIGDHIHVFARDTTINVRNRRRLETLSKIAHVVTSDDPDMATTARAVSQIITEVMDAECTLALLSEDGEWLDVVARTSHDEHTLELTNKLARWRSATGSPGEALRTRQVMLSAANPQNLATEREPDLREVVDRYEPSSVLVGPLIVADAAIGVIITSRRRGRPTLTEDDRALVSAIGPTVALYIALARRRAESMAAKQQLELIADNIPALVAFIDRDERYRYVNAAYESWFGWKPADLLGKRPRDLFAEKYALELEGRVARALAGESVRFRARFTYPKGAREVDGQYVPVRAANGELAGFTVLVQDISAEVRIAELERERLDTERKLTARLQAFLSVTGRLAGAGSTDDIATILVDEGVRALGAGMGAMWLVSPDGRELVLARERGFRGEHAATFARISLTDPGPVADCVRTGSPVIVSSRTEYAARYPQFEPEHRPTPAPPLSFALLPLRIEGRIAGCANFSFFEERRLTGDERVYLELLASHASEALRRANVAAKLHEANETRAALIEGSPAAIAVIDEKDMVLVWNAAAERLTGRTAAEQIGKPHPMSDDPVWRDELAWVRAGNVIHGRQVHRQRAGWFVDVEMYIAPIKLGDGRTYVLSMEVDVTERKRVEHGRHMVANAVAVFSKSLDLEKTLREVVRIPLDGLADWCGVDILADDGMLDRISLSRDDTGPRMPGRFAHDPSRGGVSESIAKRQIVRLRDVDETTLERLARDGDHLRALQALRMKGTLSVPLVIGDRVLGALTIASQTRNYDDLDVSIVGELATHAATAIDNARLYKEAQAARGEAEAANRAKDEFMAMLGHELRNPLAPIVTALDLMALRASNMFEKERAVIGRQVHHLSRLVDDLLDVSRITRGKVELQHERLALAAIVAKAIEQASPLLEQKNHRLVVDVPYDLHVLGDPLRLAQIVGNLVGNAAKYTPEGGLVEVSAHREAGQVVLVVRDNGIGIAPEILPHVFGLFVQAPQSSSRPAGGLGLGLTIVKSLVDMHGGTVRAASQGVGLGTEMIVALPETSDMPAAIDAPLPTLAVTRAQVSRRILVVDDNEDAALLLASILAAHGHDMRTAFDGPSALRIADEFRPEIAVLDIGLPVMDGYELAERLRSDLANVRLIAVSGYGQESDRARARAAGFQAHLAKPVAIETLVRIVDEPTA